MKIICKKSELLESIQKIEGAVSVKTTLPILNNFLFESSENSLQLTATDLEITIKGTMTGVNISKQGSITIPAKKFIDIIKEMPESDITIDIDEKNMINIKCDKINYKIMGLPKTEFPPLMEPKKEAVSLKLKQGMLKNMIRKTIFSVSIDEARKVLTGVYLIVEGKEIKMVGTDGHRLAFIKGEIPEAKAAVKIIVPTKVLNELNKFLGEDEDVNISIYENQIIFKLNNLTIISRLIEGQYPSYEQIINKLFDKKIKVKTSEFLKAVRRVSILAIDKASAIKIKAADNKLVMSATAVDVGEAEEEIFADYKGEETIIAFNSKYVLDALKAADNEEIEMQLRDSSSAGLIKPLGDDSYLYIIMPVRI